MTTELTLALKALLCFLATEAGATYLTGVLGFAATIYAIRLGFSQIASEAKDERERRQRQDDRNKELSGWKMDRYWVALQRLQIQRPSLMRNYNWKTVIENASALNINFDQNNPSDKRLYLFTELVYYKYARAYYWSQKSFLDKWHWELYEAGLSLAVSDPYFKIVHLSTKSEFYSGFRQKVEEIMSKSKTAQNI